MISGNPEPSPTDYRARGHATAPGHADGPDPRGRGRAVGAMRQFWDWLASASGAGEPAVTTIFRGSVPA